MERELGSEGARARQETYGRLTGIRTPQPQHEQAGSKCHCITVQGNTVGATAYGWKDDDGVVVGDTGRGGVS